MADPARNADISTAILARAADATPKTLSAAVAAGWVAELDAAVHQTKTRIHARINADLPAFERYLDSAVSVQARLRTLSTNVDELQAGLAHPDTGLIIRTTTALSIHKALAQEAADARALANALDYLARLRSQSRALHDLIGSGRLPEAAQTALELEHAIANAPRGLAGGVVLGDLKGKLLTSTHRISEQLDNAYARSVIASSSELLVRSSVPVPQSSTILELPAILSALSPAALAAHLTALRRDLTTQFLDSLASTPTSATPSSSGSEHRLSVHHTPPDTQGLSARLASISAVLDFVSAHLFPSLPAPHASTFAQSLFRPLTVALLDRLLIPHLPSAHSDLPPYLSVVDGAVALEARAADALGAPGPDRPVAAWAASVGMHYARARRVQLLARAREIVRASEGVPFAVEIVIQAQAAAVAVQGESPVKEAAAVVEVDADDDAWGLSEVPAPAPAPTNGSHVIAPAPEETDSWGLDDDEPEPPVPDAMSRSVSSLASTDTETDEDAWGFDDSAADASPTTALTEIDAAHKPEEVPKDKLHDDLKAQSHEEPEEDDPWGEAWGVSTEPSAPAPVVVSKPAPIVVPDPVVLAFPASVPKRATRLERLANKSKSSPAPSPAPSVPPTPAAAAPAVPLTTKPKPAPAPVRTEPAVLHESYLASARVRDVLALVRTARAEGAELSRARLFSSDAPGELIAGAGAGALDVLRALVPVVCASTLAQPGGAMRFGNDLLYLAGELGEDSVRAEAEEWYEACVDEQARGVDDVLADADGFINSAKPDAYEACEEALSRTVRQIRSVAHQWKVVLNKSRYYAALGHLVDGALTRVLADVLELDDITEDESHRLAELCRILDTLEGLFVEGAAESSFVVAYVPAWLKFSYLSVLLEASLADIRDLFDDGALVDFMPEELGKLVRALFADTPLRAVLVSRIMQGHPDRD